MSRCVRLLAFAVAFVLAALTPTLQARQDRRPGFGPGGRGLELFAGTRYSGERKVITEAISNLRRINFNDRASSLRVPRGESWEVCVNADFDDCRVIDADVPDLASIGLNRQISSVRPHFEGRGGRGGPGLYPPPGPPPGPRARVVFFEAPGFRGRSVTVNDDMPYAHLFGGRPGSVRVFGGRWELCEEVRFGGRCVVVTDDVPDLRRLPLRNGILSSVRIR